MRLLSSVLFLTSLLVLLPVEGGAAEEAQEVAEEEEVVVAAAGNATAMMEDVVSAAGNATAMKEEVMAASGNVTAMIEEVGVSGEDDPQEVEISWEEDPQEETETTRTKILLPSMVFLSDEITSGTLFADSSPSLIPFTNDFFADAEALLLCYEEADACGIQYFSTVAEGQEISARIVYATNLAGQDNDTPETPFELVPKAVAISNPLYNLHLLEVYFTGDPHSCLVTYSEETERPYPCYQFSDLSVMVEGQKLLAERFMKTRWDYKKSPTPGIPNPSSGVFSLGSFVSSARQNISSWGYFGVVSTMSVMLLALSP